MRYLFLDVFQKSLEGLFDNAMEAKEDCLLFYVSFFPFNFTIIAIRYPLLLQFLACSDLKLILKIHDLSDLFSLLSEIELGFFVFTKVDSPLLTHHLNYSHSQFFQHHLICFFLLFALRKALQDFHYLSSFLDLDKANNILWI